MPIFQPSLACAAYRFAQASIQEVRFTSGKSMGGRLHSFSEFKTSYQPSCFSDATVSANLQISLVNERILSDLNQLT